MLKPGLKYLRLALPCCVAAAAGCGDKASSPAPGQTPLRNGNALESVPIQYIDEQPTLSADGTHTAFVSGRTSSDAGSMRKVFKADWPKGAVPGAPVRATANDDLGIERSVQVSPDGLWLLITAVKGAQTDLYLQDYAGAKPAAAVTADLGVETHAVFSPDSKLIAWIARDSAPNVPTNVAYLTAIGDGAAATLKANLKAVTAAGDDTHDLLFIPTGDATYDLVVATATAAPLAGRLNYAIRRFTGVADVEAAKPTPWRSGVYLDTTVAPVAAQTRAIFAERATKTASNINVKDDPEVATNVHSEPVFADPASDKTAAFTDPPGYSVLGLGLTADGVTGFVLERVVYRCNVAVGFAYGTAFSIGPTDALNFKRFMPRLRADNLTFDVVDDFCGLNRAGGTATDRIDDKVSQMIVNTAATTTKYRILYVSRFSTAFDAACVLKLGDPEIYALDVDGDTKSITSLSNNLNPPVDTPLATGAGPCVL